MRSWPGAEERAWNSISSELEKRTLKGVVRAAQAYTTFQCKCFWAEPFYFLRRNIILSISYFLIVRVGKGLVGRITKIHRSVTLYRIHGSLRLPPLVYFQEKIQILTYLSYSIKSGSHNACSGICRVVMFPHSEAFQVRNSSVHVYVNINI